MIVNGRDVKFIYNILASIEIAGICPEGKLEKIGDLFEGEYEEQVKNTNLFMIALHRGYIETMKYKDPSFDEPILTEKELLLMDPDDHMKLQNEAIEAYMRDQKRTIETEPIESEPGKKTRASARKKSS